MVLLLLAAIWAAFLLPPILRARSEVRPNGSITDFRRQLGVLARTTPGSVARPLAVGPALGARSKPARPSRSTIKRRRDILFGLLAVMGATLVLGLVPGLRVLWGVHVVADVLFVAYVAALIRLRNVAAEREMKLRFLPTSAGAPEPALLLRRSAN